MKTQSIKAYELIKKYPGSQELGAVVMWDKIPGHQWPEFYRPISIAEMDLRDERRKKLMELEEIESEIKKFKS